jgi:hypothetical protein
MVIGVNTIPPLKFKQPYRRYNQVQKYKNRCFGSATDGITSIPNFILFRLAILYY